MLPVSRLLVTICKINICSDQIRRSFRKPVNKSSSLLSPLRKYVYSPYVEYIKRCEIQLEKTFPTAIRVYRIFKIGVQDLYKDIKLFIGVKQKLNANNKVLDCLTRKELEIYYQRPRDIFRVAPVIITSALPVVGYLIFPLVYYFPRQLLSSHFWSLQQRMEFAVLDQKSRQSYYKPIFRCLQEKLKLIKTHSLYSSWRQCIDLLKNDLRPSSDKIAQCKPLFSIGQIYHINNLTPHHIKCLLGMHNLHSGWRRRRRLVEWAKMIYLIDLAIIKEGGVAKLSSDEIRAACFLRGLNLTCTNNEETVVWLKEWLVVTYQLEEDCWSFILHLPILMSYNHPSSWIVIH